MRVLLTGAGGQLGAEIAVRLADLAAERRRGPALDLLAPRRGELDVGSRDAVLAVLSSFQPDVVIHVAAWTAVDGCEADPDRAYRDNALGTRYVAEGSRLVGAHVCYVSTDYVFDGTAGRPYHEFDLPNPLSVYGLSKLAGERTVGPAATIVRTAWLSGRGGHNMAKTVLRLAAEPGPLRFVDDQVGSPTMADDLAERVVALALQRRAGIFHVTNQGSASWFGFAREVVRLSGGDPGRVVPIATADLRPPRPARRPPNSVLDNAALRLAGDVPLPPWEVSLARLVAELTA